LNVSSRTAIRGALLLIVAQLIAAPAMGTYGRPFHCGSKIIYVGMTEADVFKYCGEPSSKSTELREVRSDKNRVLSMTVINRWIYEGYSATRILVFVDERLQSIEVL
jgi:hypothetical protein